MLFGCFAISIACLVCPIYRSNSVENLYNSHTCVFNAFFGGLWTVEKSGVLHSPPVLTIMQPRGIESYPN